MASVLEVVGARSGSAPLTYTLTELGTVDLQTVFAHFDGSGASGGFRPCLTLRAQNGAILGRLFPTEELAAGDSADVTYSPFFRRSTVTPAGDPFPTVVASLAATRVLVGYWRLGDAASPFLDTSGYSAGPANMSRITAGGTAMTLDYTPGALATDDDGAVAFNSSTGATNSDYLHANNVGVAGRFDFTIGTLGSGAMTAAAFVKPFASASTFRGAAVAMWAEGASGFGGWQLGVTWPGRQIVFRKGGNGQPTGTATGPVLAADTWTFVVATHDSVNGIKLYVNGSLATTTAGDYSNSPNFNIGATIALESQSPGQQNRFYGGVDEVTVWASALSSIEIANLAVAAGF